MNAVLDVHYDRGVATGACLEFRTWNDAHSCRTTLATIEAPSAYRPGRFFERELPCLLAVLGRTQDRYEHLLIDGYVYLKPPLIDGLGARLEAALPYRVRVVGIAKNPLSIADRFVAIMRGRSRRPLFISAVNLELEAAAAIVAGMHGPYRIPTLVRLADRACRGGGVACPGRDQLCVR